MLILPPSVSGHCGAQEAAHRLHDRSRPLGVRRSNFSLEDFMAKLARDVMTPDPACCSANATLDEVAKLMVQNDCGEIPILDASDRPIGVITDRDIVCRAVAEGKNPTGHTVESVMSKPVVTVRTDTPIDDVLATMEKHQIRRVPVIDESGCCMGIIAQADLASEAPPQKAAELVREVSRSPR
jgi:CBS domain-containing protein